MFPCCHSSPEAFGESRMSMQRIGLQMLSLAPFTVREFEKERTRLGPKSVYSFGVRNWMCGVSACENMQKRVSHGETVRVGSSAIRERESEQDSERSQSAQELKLKHRTFLQATVYLSARTSTETQ